MKKSEIRVSVVIVNYKVEKELIACVSSIVNSNPKVSYEIIIVDNDVNSNLKMALKKYRQIKYLRSSKNIGFGAGNNLGVKSASGKYIFFLNPDTLVDEKSIDILYAFTINNPESGMIAPLLFNLSGKAYSNQGSNEYDLKSAVVISSFVNKLFPNNFISRSFFHKNWTKESIEEFDVVPGTAFMINKDLFKKVGMFDENFFLYFEEYDLAKRIKKLRYKNYIVPQAKLLHVWEASTKKRKNIRRIFSESRDYFFKKNYGAFFALIVKIASNLGKYELFLSLILGITVFLGLFRINELMTFIGDQGWFYLSARDMFINGQIPLVGIASSHPWLHQGAFWTYLLAFFLWVFNFNPVSGAYLTVILGILSVIGMYILGSVLFSKRIGLIASLLYATSPLVVYSMRFPYHTSPIPLLVITLVYSLYKITQGRGGYLPLAVFLLAVLYNFELATIVLWGVLLSVLAYKFIKNRNIFRQIFNRRIIFFSFLSLLTPLLPIILYDIRNGFSQTLKFTAWGIYRVVSLFGYNSQEAFSINKIIPMLDFMFNNFRKLIFAESSLVSFLILAFMILGAVYVSIKRRNTETYGLILTTFFVPFILILFNQIPSDAYLPIFFPITILLFSSVLNLIMVKRAMVVLVFIFIIILSAININFMLKNNFMFDDSSKYFTLSKRLQVTWEVLNITRNKDYNLIGKGPGSEFESFTMNYEYLMWWLRHGPSKNNENLKIVISESSNGIRIENNLQK